MIPPSFSPLPCSSPLPNTSHTPPLQASKYNWFWPGPNAKAADFTQLVWKGSQQIGCAYNPNCRNRVHVCQYWPKGKRTAGRHVHACVAGLKAGCGTHVWLA